MGLAGIAESTGILGMGQDRASTRRLVGAFGQVASGVVAVGGSTAPGRRPGSRDPRALIASLFSRARPGVTTDEKTDERRWRDGWRYRR